MLDMAADATTGAFLAEACSNHPLEIFANRKWRSTGILAIQTEQQCFFYTVAHGLVYETIVKKGDWQSLLEAPKLIRKLQRSCIRHSVKPWLWPLSAGDAYLINRVAWWINFGIRHQEGTFLSIEALNELYKKQK